MTGTDERERSPSSPVPVEVRGGRTRSNRQARAPTSSPSISAKTLSRTPIRCRVGRTFKRRSRWSKVTEGAVWRSRRTSATTPKLRAAVDEGVAQLGALTTVCANAGILPMAMGDPNPLDFQDAVDVDLLGVMNAVTVAVPHLLLAEAGGSIIITGSTAAMMPGTVDMDPSAPWVRVAPATAGPRKR